MKKVVNNGGIAEHFDGQFWRFNMYVPQLGRFISRDPIEYNGGINLYEYAASNPVVGVDPEGTQLPIAIPWGTILKTGGFFALCRAGACIAAIDELEGACAIYNSGANLVMCWCQQLKASTATRVLCRFAALGIDVVAHVRNYIRCAANGW